MRQFYRVRDQFFSNKFNLLFQCLQFGPVSSEGLNLNLTFKHNQLLSILFAQKIDVVTKCVEDMNSKTKEYLQPNPSKSLFDQIFHIYSFLKLDWLIVVAIFLKARKIT